MGNVLSARQTILYLLSFQGYLSILDAVRLLRRHHKSRWDQRHPWHLETVNTTPHTSHFLIDLHAHAWLKSCVCRAHIMCHESSPVFVLTLFDYSTFLSLLTIFSLIILSFLLPSTSSSTMWWTNFLCILANEDLGTLAAYDPLTCYEPNDYHISEATEPYIQESSVEHGSPNDFEYDDVTIGKALSSPLFTQEREDDASRRRAYHSQDEGLSSSQSSSVSRDRTLRPVVKPFDSQIPNVREIPSHSSESEQIRILLERQREQILTDCQAEIRKTRIPGRL